MIARAGLEVPQGTLFMESNGCFDSSGHSSETLYIVYHVARLLCRLDDVDRSV